MKTELIVEVNNDLNTALKRAEKKLHFFVEQENSIPKCISHSVLNSPYKTFTVTILVVY